MIGISVLIQDLQDIKQRKLFVFHAIQTFALFVRGLICYTPFPIISQDIYRFCFSISTNFCVLDVILDEIVLEEIRRVTYYARARTKDFVNYTNRKVQLKPEGS